jgi:hypothetical protein
MSTLVSPGVSITVTDESFYASVGAGTVPLIVVATAANKTSSDGSGIAEYTKPENAGKVYNISSQRELLINYGNPTFYTSGGTPLHGYELNEYGLEAARSYLGFANRAYVLRADIDLAKLEPSATPPTEAPANGQYWLDVENTTWGVKRRVNGVWQLQSTFTVPAEDVTDQGIPTTAYGVDYDIGVVYFNPTGTTASTIKICERRSGAWFVIGEASWTNATSNELQINTHLAIPTTRANGTSLQDNDIFLQTTAPNQGTTISIKVYNSASGEWVSEDIIGSRYSSAAYAYYANQGGPVDGDLWADYDETPTAEITLRRWVSDADTSENIFYSEIIAVVDPLFDLTNHINNAGVAAMWISINDSGVNDPNGYIPVYFTSDQNNDGFASLSDAVSDINNSVSGSNNPNLRNKLRAEIVNGNQIKFTQTEGWSVKFFNGSIAGWTPGILGVQYGTFGDPNSAPAYSEWAELSYVSSATAPLGDIADKTLWYDNVISIDNLDLLTNLGTQWVTFSGDKQISVLAPTTNSQGATLLIGDVWVSTDNLDMYPQIYQWDGQEWVLVDNADQETSEGVVFGDFRASSTSALFDDAPNALLYPQGILGWNLIASGGTIRKWDENEDRWRTVSGLQADGSPNMLRNAQRQMVITAMQGAVNANEDVRNEGLRFNLIAAPNYPEMMDEMISLNVDRKETAFVVGDTPMRLAPDNTSITNWATNANTATENGEQGLTIANPYASVHYPSALTSGLNGEAIMVPPSHMVLRTMAYNDQVAYPWFAPAGYQRGLVSNATSVGYLNAEQGEYVPVALSQGQRDNLYINKINPIGTFTGRGIVVFGQKTLNPVASALDRINVARLVNYIRDRLDEAMRPFLFEPNDDITRQNAKTTVDRFLGQLVTSRGLFDFLTVCDSSNNTPDRIDRNELWVDIAIQPVKTIEFIYVPIRIQNTLGETGSN